MTFPPLRAWLLVVATSLFLLSASYFLFGRPGLFLGLLLSIFWNYAMLLHKHHSAIEYFHGTLVLGRDPWNLFTCAHSYQNKHTGQCPDIYLTKNSHPIFLVSTSEWDKSFLLISEGLINMLSSGELDAIIALGISTIKHRQTFIRYTLDRMALSWMSLGTLIDNFLPFRDLKIITRFNYLIAWIHLKLAYTQSLQAKADLETFQAIQNSRNLATALWKIQGRIDTHPIKLPRPFTHQSIIGLPKSRRTAFQFILPIELRLRFLVGYFPI